MKRMQGQTEYLTIIGKKGKGKTTLAKEKIRESRAEVVFIFDFLGEYIDIASERVFIFRENIKDFCRFVWNFAAECSSSLVVFDEVDLYGKKNFYIDFLYRLGRHNDLDLIAVSRRFYDLPLTIRALTDVFCLFQITEKRDLDYLRRYQDEAFMQKLMALEKFQYLTMTL